MLNMRILREVSDQKEKARERRKQEREAHSSVDNVRQERQRKIAESRRKLEAMARQSDNGPESSPD